MAETGVFSSSSDLLNLIDRNMRASVAENYVSGVITDTPTYEKNGWTGDAQLSLPAASLQFDTERHMLKALQDMRDDQLADRRGAAAVAGLGQLRLPGRAGVQAGERPRDADLGRLVVRRARGSPTSATATARTSGATTRG